MFPGRSSGSLEQVSKEEGDGREADKGSNRGDWVG